MKYVLLRRLGVLAAGIILFSSANAKVWRVNNNAGIAADFSQLSAAIASPAVLAGDTIYLEGSVNAYNSATLNKRLVLVGPGYFLGGANANPGLQFDPNPSRVNITIDSLASGSLLAGLTGTFFLNSNADFLTLTRCNINVVQNATLPNSRMVSLVINKCYGTVNLSSFTMENPSFTNCILTSLTLGAATINALIRNNVIVSATILNSYVANNIFTGSASFTGSAIRYNIATQANILPAGNNNQNGISAAVLFDNSASNDGRYQLRAGSPAIGAGEPLGGVTPDIGAFGTADPYRLSGIPSIPTIYQLSGPSTIPSTSTILPVIIGTRANN